MGYLRKNMGLFMLMMAFWVILGGELTLRQGFTGFLSCIAAIGIYNWILKYSGADRVSWISLSAALRFGSVLAHEIVLAALQHLHRIVKGNGGTSTCRLVLSVESELAVTLVANAITLTPGTVTMEADRKVLTVLFYGDIPHQCPLDLVLMTERLQRTFPEYKAQMKEAGHA